MIFVSGASGTVGSELVRQLSAAGARVRAGWRVPERAARLPGVEVVPFDFTEPARVRAALTGIERAFLLTPSSPAQVDLEASFAAEAARAGVRHIVKMSVWRAPAQGYTFARVHHAAERKVLASGIPCTFLRPNMFMQNLIYAAETIREQMAILQPARSAKISMVDTRDVARAAVRVLGSDDHFGAAHELSGPESLDYSEVAEIVGTVIGKQVRYVDVPEEAFRHSLRARGTPAWLVDAMLDLQDYANRGFAAEVTDTLARLLAPTGARPVTFARFIRDHAEVFA